MVSYDMIKYERGQVWVIRHKQKNDAVGHEQNKDRPWVILSIGKFNKSSGMVTAAPLTSRDSARTVSQVQFFNDLGRSNVILCEQIKTFDYTSGAYVFDYMGQLSSEIMEKVDVAMSIHLGMHYSPITLNKLYDSMEAIIKSVGHMQQKANTPVFTEDDVLQFAEKLQMLAGVPAHEEVSATTENKYLNPLDKLRGIPEEEDSSSDEAEIPTESVIKPFYMNSPKDSKKPNDEIISSVVKTPRMKWTKEKCEEFIHDCDTLPMTKVMDKWHLYKKTRFYSTKNYVQNLLTKMTES